MNEEINTVERYKDARPNSHPANDSSTLCDHVTPAAVLFTNSIISEDQRPISNKLVHQEKVIFPVLP